jgi:hypothetical protein
MNQETIGVIAERDTSPHVRAAAIRKITNQAKLFKIANSDPTRRLQVEAVHNLTDLTALTHIAINHHLEEVRSKAKEKLPLFTITSPKDIGKAIKNFEQNAPFPSEEDYSRNLNSLSVIIQNSIRNGVDPYGWWAGWDMTKETIFRPYYEGGFDPQGLCLLIDLGLMPDLSDAVRCTWSSKSDFSMSDVHALYLILQYHREKGSSKNRETLEKIKDGLDNRKKWSERPRFNIEGSPNFSLIGSYESDSGAKQAKADIPIIVQMLDAFSFSEERLREAVKGVRSQLALKRERIRERHRTIPPPTTSII